MKADYFIHYEYGYYGYKEHYAYGEIKVMASDDEHMGVFLELKGAGSRNMEYVLQAQNRDWYSFLNRCLDCGGVIRRFDLAINDMCGLLDIPTLSEKYKNGGADCRCKNYENVQGGKLSGKNRNLASTLYIGSKARLASKNMNPKDLQYIMGHSNISITMNWYAHASIDTAKSEVQRLIA